MLSENLVNLRKAKRLSQEDVAKELHVVRQTVSKWEKGTSVPDAHILVALGSFYGISVNELLGASAADVGALDEVAQQLYLINEQLAVKNRRSRQIWNAIRGVVLGVVVLYVLYFTFIISALIYNGNEFKTQTQGTVSPIVTPYDPSSK